jgi:hypothetical protein
VATTAIVRHTQLELFGDGTPANLGMTLAEFVRSTRVQADWFVEPTLTEADRDDLWALLRRTTQGSNILAGSGDLPLATLRTATAADWTGLAAFGRGCDAGSNTVRIQNPAALTLPQRVALGTTLIALEGVIPPEVLRLTVSDIQLAEVHAGGLIPALTAYWNTFHPHLQRRYTVAPGARGPEFQNVVDLLRGTGIAPFASLQGRVRNLHRFSVLMLNRLVINFADTSRLRPVDLVLHTAHDESSFQAGVALYEDLIVNSPHLVLFLEGQEHLVDITAAIPVIAATYGQLDGTGTPRIAQAIIAGHGQSRSVELAGTGAPAVANENVQYPAEKLDLDTNLKNTEDLLDALLKSLDPATAKLVFDGCLVGANKIPENTPAAGVAAHIAATPSLATFTERRGVAAGLAPGFIQAGRASLVQGDRLHDGHGKIAISYSFDPDAFGPALAYVATGHEPEGMMRAAVEVAALSGPVVAANQLRTRLAAGVDPGHLWYDEITIAFVQEALDGVAAGAGVDLQRLNTLAWMAEVPFLARWPSSFGITVAHFAGGVNPKMPFAASIYARIAATPTFTAAADADAQAMRLIVEQAWMALPAAREAALLAFLDATPAITAQVIASYLDVFAILLSAPTLFPPGAVATPGRIRLALAWFHWLDGDADVRAFLDAQVVAGAGAPELSAAVRAELDGFQETDILKGLGRLMAVAPPPVAGGAALPAANAELVHTGDNRALIEPRPYEATVTAAVLNVRDRPHMGGTVFTTVRLGESVSVAGFTHNWAGIDLDGKLGFVHRSFITPP